MLVQPTQDEGASSERLSVEQPSPSPAPTSEVPNESLPDSSSAQPSEVPFEQQPDPSPRPSPRPSPKPSPTPIVPDSIPEPTGENLGDHSSNDTIMEDEMDSPKWSMIFVSLYVNRQNSVLRSFNSKKESSHIEAKSKFLHDTIAAQRKFFAQTKIRGNKKQTSNQESIKKSDDDLLKACGELQTF
ncbi:hypothetical protein Tco_0736797 [Tanacetum coccineum]